MAKKVKKEVCERLSIPDDDLYRYIPNGLREFCVPIESVKLFDKNPRRNDRAVPRLAELIKKNLFRKPIVVDQNGVIRAGNTAYKAALKLGMKMIPVAQSHFSDESSAIDYVISDNKASDWSSWDDDVLRKLLTAEKIPDDPNRLSSTGFNKNEMAKLFLKDEIASRRQQMEKKGSECGTSSLFTVDVGDIRTYDKIKPESVDFIITDPPYIGTYNHLVDDLARQSAKWLNPDGMLAMMRGDEYLDVSLDMCRKYLDYFWVAAIVYKGGPYKLICHKNVIAKHKLIILFKKKNAKLRLNITLPDTFISEKRTDDEKSLHKWQQGIEEFDYIVKTLAKPGSVIVDPFLGSGTTGVAALMNRCYFHGFDINEQNVNIAKARLSEVKL